MDGMHMHDGMPTVAWTSITLGAWTGAAVSFLGMWLVMTVAMMLPSIAPALWRYRRALGGTRGAHAARLTVLVSAGYFAVWTVIGLFVFLLGAASSAAETGWPAFAHMAPIGAGAIVLLAGVVQLTAWKARRLARCREVPVLRHPSSKDAPMAWRHGLRLGVHCTLSCAGPMATLLVIGAMDPRVMAIGMVAITAERLLPAGDRVARALGLGAIVVGSVLIARGVGFG